MTDQSVRPFGRAKAVRYVSRQNYGRSVSSAEKDMEVRRRVEETSDNRPRPKISGDGEGADAL